MFAHRIYAAYCKVAIFSSLFTMLLVLPACQHSIFSLPSANQPNTIPGGWVTHTPGMVGNQANVISATIATPRSTASVMVLSTKPPSPSAFSTQTPTPTSIQVLAPSAMPTVSTTLSSRQHIIVAGDTFLQLSIDYDVALEQIIEANPTLDPTNLQIGESVLIPFPEDRLPRTKTSSAPVIPTSEPAVDFEAMEKDMLVEVNAQRTDRNVPQLHLDIALRSVARVHAQDMADRHFFDHVTPEGITLRDRLQMAGINKHWVGENIQVNTRPPHQAAAEAMRWFLDSEPHMNNILAEPFTRLGVGVAEGPPGWYIFVLVFAGES